MLENNTRKAAVAGRFYPSGKASLEELIDGIYSREKNNIAFANAEKEIYGAVVPHAGYVYSAYQAVHFFGLLSKRKKKTDTFVIINPNHTGYGEAIALDSHKYWDTPLGKVEQDEAFIRYLGFPRSDIAHENEHSGEVMLPLLKYFMKDDFKVVLVTLSQQNFENAKLLAERIEKAKNQLGRNIVLIASSDFTHFKDVETSKHLDDLVLDEMRKQNARELENVVRNNRISVCGFGPIMSLMEYSALQGNYQTEIIARGHSGQVSPSEKVVNYISVLFTNDKHD